MDLALAAPYHTILNTYLTSTVAIYLVRAFRNVSLCESFERLHCEGFRGRDYLLNHWHWHLHIIVDDDELLRPLTDGVDVEVEPEVSDQSSGLRNRAVNLMRTGVSEKSRGEQIFHFMN